MSPHQDLLDANIDCFQHEDTGLVLMSAAARFPKGDASTDEDDEDDG